MNYEEFLTRVIDEGIEAAKADYPEGSPKREGALIGFEKCRNSPPARLRHLYTVSTRNWEQARRDVHAKRITEDEYWRIRAVQAEIEWVCNVVSAMLINENQPIIMHPTARGVLKAAGVLGVKEVRGTDIKLEQFVHFKATFSPRDVGDLKDGAADYIGKDFEWSVGWKITEDDGGPYVGEFACIINEDHRAPFLWVPSGDLVIKEVLAELSDAESL